MYENITLDCIDCSKTFLFTSGEQAFFAEKGFSSRPNRCPDCRKVRKLLQGNVKPFSSLSSVAPSSFSHDSSSFSPSSSSFSPANSMPRYQNTERPLFPITCDKCSINTNVPFRPIPGKPVFCRSCYIARGPAYRLVNSN